MAQIIVPHITAIATAAAARRDIAPMRKIEGGAVAAGCPSPGWW